MQKFYIETYGCQMNVADSELIITILKDKGYELTSDYKKADYIFVNTCSVREKAEQRVRGKLSLYKGLKKQKKLKVALVGCMAQRIKNKLFEEEPVLDIIAGPDAYKNLPELIKKADKGLKAADVKLSKTETYQEISPTKIDKNGVCTFVSILRGCDNMCSFCIVPFTRGRERSRSPESILTEIKQLVAQGYKEVTLLGQNVNKYNWNNKEVNFAKLLQKTADIDKNLRIRFSTPYPQDFTDEVIKTIARNENICNSIHLPIQSGSSRILEKMKRGYTREWYLERIESIRNHIPDCAITTDVIAGFCSETEQEHNETIELFRQVKFNSAFMFKYSERPNNYAQRNYTDDIDEDTKLRRLNEIIELQNKLSLESNKNDIDKTFKILVEGTSKRSEERLFGRNSQNKVIIFEANKNLIGKYVNVTVTDFTQATLLGEIRP